MAGEEVVGGQWTVVVAAIAILLITTAARAQDGRKHTETLLAPFPPEVRESAVISPDGRRIAYVRRAEGREMVVIDGREQNRFDRVTALTFSPDSKWLAYAAADSPRQTAGTAAVSRRLEWYIVTEARQRGPFVRVGPPRFSADSRRLAHVAELPDGNRVVMVNNQPGKPWQRIFESGIVFSPNPNGPARLAYGAAISRPGEVEKWRVVLDGEEGPTFDYLGSATGIQFSPDGGRLAYAAANSRRLTAAVSDSRLPAAAWSIVLDGKSQAAYDNVGEVAFCTDGKRVAYAACRGEKWMVVLDGKEEKVYDAIGTGTLAFSPDGKQLAYAAQSGKKWLVVCGSQEGKPYEAIGQIHFSPSGQLAYVAKAADGERVIAGGREQAGFDRVGGGTLVFSRDGARLGYVARVGRASLAVIDGKRKHRYDMVGYLTFAPDGKTYVYAATQAGKVFTVVGDREAAHRYEAIWTIPERRLMFDGRRQFHYLAVREGKIYLVVEEAE